MADVENAYRNKIVYLYANYITRMYKYLNVFRAYGNIYIYIYIYIKIKVKN